jgi:hypothetical protein
MTTTKQLDDSKKNLREEKPDFKLKIINKYLKKDKPAIPNGFFGEIKNKYCR